MSEITVVKRSHTGGPMLHYTGDVVERGETWVCLRARFSRDDRDAGYVVFRRGDLFTEWFYADRWYNVFEMRDANDGHLKGWYCNVTHPAVIRESSIEADDLALDVFVSPNGNILVLDEDEFAALSLSDDERRLALMAVEEIKGMVARREQPFGEVMSRE
jgi:protein associated with RNAse G/E